MFLHLHRHGKSVERAGFEQSLDYIAEHLRIQVVEIGFEDGDSFLRSVLGQHGLRLADGQANYVGVTGKVAAAGAISGFFNGHRWKRRESFGQYLHNRCARRSDQFDLDVGGINWRTLQQLYRGWDRHRQNSVSAFHGAAADVQWGAHNLIHSQRRGSNGGADDIHHRVHRAHLVKVHFVNLSVMNLGLRRAQGLEDGDRGALCAITDAGPVNYLAYFA